MPATPDRCTLTAATAHAPDRPLPQSDQFPTDLHAPPDWVRQVEGRGVTSARWEDGSYGNDAAPSWILVDDARVVHAQAFYYTPDNAERFDDGFGEEEPYVSLLILRDEEIAAACSMRSDTFLEAAALAAGSRQQTPVDALLAGLRSLTGVVWDPDLPGVTPA